MSKKYVRRACDIFGVTVLTCGSNPGARMVCNYLNHAAVYGQGGATHVDVGCRSGALPLRETAAWGWVGRGVGEGMRNGILVG